ncbi:MAG: trypsin-like peptidase domain-containing protein [Phycisphaerae bacterium]|nr:trypsin-like peptidase domain-containing protein [Phycisphaerae bacterium]
MTCKRMPRHLADLRSQPIVCLVLIAIAIGMAVAGRMTIGGEQPQADRNQFEKLLDLAEHAIVTVKYVSKTSYGEETDESDEEFYAVMIEPTGLVLCSASQMSSGWGGQSVPKDIKILIGDDTEGVEAKVLAKDSELDLLWLQITNPDKKGYNCIKFDRSATPRLGDWIYSIEKKGKYYDRAAIISEDRVGGILKKPRDLVAPSRGVFSDIGMPVFAANGGLVGMFVMHSSDSGALDAGESEWSDTEYMVLPTESLKKATEQAKKHHAMKENATADSSEEDE